ncbi:C4-hydroxylase [Patellaria atrata CBS 101060]|uniref:C4-hydroxylase n=1 Tax=Patellaria atrata CBS 101060 TaxID=1346257 RepID=A0A9P4SIZ3_9PEZI|nr:C4-hydroxylase [Patellaria atrata CBS 101060]
MANSSLITEIPPLPQYTLRPRPPLISWLPDEYLSLVVLVIAYWIVSLFFHIIDVFDLFPQYRLHTPAEILKRNHVSRYEVFRDVVIQQAIQTLFGFFLAVIEPQAYYGKEDYDVAVWAQRIRYAQSVVPPALSLIGLDAGGFAKELSISYPTVAGILAGGRYPWLVQHVLIGSETAIVPAFASWELWTAKTIYWAAIPTLQFILAVCWLDTWQYFLHRFMHMNKWMYTTFHSRHHRLYVPYAYGALYNHPFEGFLLDTLGAGLGYLITGMTTRQGMLFFTCSTVKTVDDHCGYSLPWDPIQRLSSNNAAYHDIHHQSFGIKTNFSQPFFTFWDKLLGTMWTGGDVSARYARARLAAQRKVDLDNAKASLTSSTPADSLTSSEAPYENIDNDTEILISSMQADALPSIPPGKATKQAIGSRNQVLSDKQGGGPSVLAEETAEEKEAQASLLRSPRRSTQGGASGSGSLKGLRDKVNGSLRQRGGSVLGCEMKGS